MNKDGAEEEEGRRSAEETMEDNDEGAEEEAVEEGPEQKRVYLKIPKPVDEMSEEELDAFAESVLKALASRMGSGPSKDEE